MFRLKSPLVRYGNMFRRLPYLLLSALAGVLGGVVVLWLVARQPAAVTIYAEPLPGGTPKLSLSTKTVAPTVASPGGAELTYTIHLVNTGAWTATAASLTDVLPAATTYVSPSLQTSGGEASVQDGVLTWNGEVGFDSEVFITFRVGVSPTFTGLLTNTAVVTDPGLSAPVMLTALTAVTDEPLLSIGKVSAPALPGPNKELVYTLTVANGGQPAENLPITVTDQVPFNTTFKSAGPDGSEAGGVVTWNRSVTLGLGESTQFTFSVDIDDVVSGTVITNDAYGVAWSAGLAAGTPYSITVVDPVLLLSKQTIPDRPGSNRDMTYLLTLYNGGSLATDLIITDRIPAGVPYGGSVVSWAWPRLDTGEVAEFTFTVQITDVAGFALLNNDYWVCARGEGICALGQPLASWVNGPTFETSVYLDPIAKKPGGGGGPVTPTLVLRNVGPGDAIDAQAALYFENISVSANDLYATPAIGTLPPFPDGPACGGGGSNCVSYVWRGSLAVGDAVTFTTLTGQSTIGGGEGTPYTATIVVSDTLGAYTTAPITGTATGHVTHFANLIPTKSASEVIGPGQLMTYTINVWNSALSTEGTPVLTDVVPLSTTLVSVSDGGVTQTLSGRTVVSWTLPALSTGSQLNRTFTVRVDGTLVSGTQILNNNYRVTWRESETSTVPFNAGPPVTTTVREVGLIDSFKVVTPTWALPGTGNVLTYVVNIVNTSALPLTGVRMDDILPWQVSTYQRNAVASAGAVVSDIVTVHWTGNVAPFSSQPVTFTVLVDPDYEGPVVNTAVISHSDLLTPVVVSAVAYITSDPVLLISKTASPDPVSRGSELEYTIHVSNVGQQATGLVITDVVPAETSYVPGSATASGQLQGNAVRWNLIVLPHGEARDLKFRVNVQAHDMVVNDNYGVSSAEGVSALGQPVVTKVKVSFYGVYLPLVRR